MLILELISANYLAVKLTFVHSFIAIKPDGVQVFCDVYENELIVVY